MPAWADPRPRSPRCSGRSMWRTVRRRMWQSMRLPPPVRAAECDLLAVYRGQLPRRRPRMQRLWRAILGRLVQRPARVLGSLRSIRQFHRREFMRLRRTPRCGRDADVGAGDARLVRRADGGSQAGRMPPLRAERQRPKRLSAKRVRSEWLHPKRLRRATVSSDAPNRGATFVVAATTFDSVHLGWKHCRGEQPPDNFHDRSRSEEQR